MHGYQVVECSDSQLQLGYCQLSNKAKTELAAGCRMRVTTMRERTRLAAYFRRRKLSEHSKAQQMTFHPRGLLVRAGPWEAAQHRCA